MLLWRQWRNHVRTFQSMFGYKCLHSYYQSFFFSITCTTKLLIKNVIKFPIWRIFRLANKLVITRHHGSKQVCSIASVYTACWMLHDTAWLYPPDIGKWGEYVRDQMYILLYTQPCSVYKFKISGFFWYTCTSMRNTWF